MSSKSLEFEQWIVDFQAIFITTSVVSLTIICWFIESRAICRYLESKYKGRGTELIPKKNSKAEGLFEQASSIELSYFDPYASEIAHEKVIKK